MKKIVVAAIALAFATPAFADFYIVQDTGTGKCSIAQARPTATGQKVVGPDGAAYKTRQEATTAMKTVKDCGGM